MKRDNLENVIMRYADEQDWQSIEALTDFLHNLQTRIEKLERKEYDREADE